MNRTAIEWCDYTINPVKGLCPMACSYCYARRMYKRFKWEEKVRWYPPAWDLVDTLKKPSRVFVGSTFELFHESLPYNWMEYNLLTVKKYPQHTFIFLTKLAQNLPREFPDNCWVGVTALNDAQLLLGETQFEEIKASVKFLSLEPLKNRLDAIKYMKQPNWIIVGQQTPLSVKTEPKIEWVREIVEAADKAGIPVFLKDNLLDMDLPYDDVFFPEQCPGSKHLRQELPK
jgi:protein gp37